MSENVHFSSNQIAAIEWLATDKNQRTPVTEALLAQSLGITDRTIRRWKEQPEFTDAITARARELLNSDLPQIYAAMVREALKGNFQHIKLAFEMTGEYSPKQEIEHSGEVKTQVQYIDIVRPKDD